MATFSKSQVIEQGSLEKFAHWAECYKVYQLPNGRNFIAIRSERDEQAMFGSQSSRNAKLVWEKGRTIPFDWNSMFVDSQDTMEPEIEGISQKIEMSNSNESEFAGYGMCDICKKNIGEHSQTWIGYKRTRKVKDISGGVTTFEDSYTDFTPIVTNVCSTCAKKEIYKSRATGLAFLAAAILVLIWFSWQIKTDILGYLACPGFAAGLGVWLFWGSFVESFKRDEFLRGTVRSYAEKKQKHSQLDGVWTEEEFIEKRNSQSSR